MVHLVDNPRMRLNKQTATVSAGQLREIAKAVSQMIAVTVAEKPKQLLALLNHYGLSVNGSASEKEIIEAVIETGISEGYVKLEERSETSTLQ